MKIKEALHSDKTVPYDKLTVNVAAGVVTISGKVNSKDVIDHVVQLVQAIPGVVQVRPDDPARQLQFRQSHFSRSV